MHTPDINPEVSLLSDFQNMFTMTEGKYLVILIHF